MLLCLDTSRILNTEAPRRAALVKNPLRSEWAPIVALSSPTSPAYAFVISHTLLADNRASRTLPPLRTGRKIGPLSILAAWHHSINARQGQQAAPLTMAMV